MCCDGLAGDIDRYAVEAEFLQDGVKAVADEN